MGVATTQEHTERPNANLVVASLHKDGKNNTCFVSYLNHFRVFNKTSLLCVCVCARAQVSCSAFVVEAKRELDSAL